MAATEDNPSDGDLVRAVFAGDRDAYNVLVDRHLRCVYGAAVRILCNPADAEDVAQDTFIRALERLYLYDLEHPFRNWLVKIATNLALNRLRSRRRERVLHLKVAQEPRDAEPPREPEREVPDARQWQYWLEQLDESQRTAIVLFHFQDMPYAQIAEALDVPINTVRTYLHRGRKRLRELMTRAELSENGSWRMLKTSG